MNDLAFEIFLAWELWAITMIMIEIASAANQIAASENPLLTSVFMARD